MIRKKVMPEFQSREHVIILRHSWVYEKQNLVCIVNEYPNPGTPIGMQKGLILLCMTLLLHTRHEGRPAKHGKQLSVETDFTFSGGNLVITIRVRRVFTRIFGIRKFWLMSQPQKKKSMVKNACFQYDFINDRL